MNPSTEKMLKEEIPRIRELLEGLGGLPIHNDHFKITNMPGSVGRISGLKPGVKITSRGGFYMQGKGFIKKEDAYE